MPPFLVTVTRRNTCQIVWLWLRYRHHQRPDSPAHKLPHPTQAGLAHAASLLSRHSIASSSSPRQALLDDTEDVPLEKDTPERARHRLDGSYADSLERERARRTGRASNVPVLARRAHAHALDTREAEEDRALSDLDERVRDSGDESERERHAVWARQSAETREALREKRQARRKSDAQAEEGLTEELAEWKKARAEKGLPVRGRDEPRRGVGTLSSTRK